MIMDHWYVDVVGHSISVRGLKRVIARMAIASNSTRAEEGFEHARLISAAPELLEALQWALAELDGDTRYETPAQRVNCFDKARAAIAKAAMTSEVPTPSPPA